MTQNSKTLKRALLVVGLLLAAVIVALLQGCATATDLRDLAGKLELADESTRSEAKERILEIVDRIDDRAEDAIGGIESLTGGGLIGLVATVGLHLYRNHRRKVRGEAI